MADVFLSYKRADVACAAQIVALLEGEGWSVWWDTRLVGGERWDAVIEREINAARCVVVIWSPNSVDSGEAARVHLEAHNGRERGILVPVTIEGARPPFSFSQFDPGAQPLAVGWRIAAGRCGGFHRRREANTGTRCKRIRASSAARSSFCGAKRR